MKFLEMLSGSFNRPTSQRHDRNRERKSGREAGLGCHGCLLPERSGQRKFSEGTLPGGGAAREGELPGGAVQYRQECTVDGIRIQRGRYGQRKRERPAPGGLGMLWVRLTDKGL
jgi:hypothetical protein